MRVTQTMLSRNFLNNLSNNYDKLGKLQDQIASQKKINKPSDDPVVAMQGINYRTNLQEIQQYKRNFSEAHDWLDNADSALDEATQAMQRIRELTVEASNGSLEDNQRKSIATEITQLRDHLVEVANTKVGNKYIFNGTDTVTKPVDLSTNPPTFSTNNNPVNIELAKGISLKVNPDTSVFSGQQSGDLFFDLNNLINDLNSSNPSNIGGYLDKLDQATNKITNERASLGAVSNRIDLMETRNGEQEVTATKMMSDNEDADLDKVITDFIAQQSAFRAALGVGASIIQPTLLDFLK